MTEGFGRMLRKEDQRFIRGKGNYVDDITLPGMLHMELLRSPYAHARIKSIDTSAAAALPGVVAVVTGELMAAHNLAWMPTLSGDTQAVLARAQLLMQESPREAQAVLEGVAFAFRDGMDALLASGASIETIAVIGGGARSAYWGRILSSVLRRPLAYRDSSAVGPAYGAARLARMPVAVTGDVLYHTADE